jgi:FtsH-binding integral membrane protein
MSTVSTLQTFELLPVALVLLACTAYLVVQTLSPERREHAGVRFALGLIPWIVGVAIVLISGFDIIPDDAENNLALISVIVVSALLVLGTGYRLARR